MGHPRIQTEVLWSCWFCHSRTPRYDNKGYICSKGAKSINLQDIPEDCPLPKQEDIPQQGS